MATAYVAQIAKELDELQAYVQKHDLQDDEFAGRELERLQGMLASETAKPTKFLTACVSGLNPGDLIDTYIGFGAAVNLCLAAKFYTVFVIESPAEHAQWNSSRLASGMMGGHVYDTCAEALAAAQELQTL